MNKISYTFTAYGNDSEPTTKTMHVMVGSEDMPLSIIAEYVERRANERAKKLGYEYATVICIRREG